MLTSSEVSVFVYQGDNSVNEEHAWDEIWDSETCDEWRKTEK